MKRKRSGSESETWTSFFYRYICRKTIQLKKSTWRKEKKQENKKQTHSHARLIGLRIVRKYSFGFRFAVSLTESLLADANTINLASALKAIFCPENHFSALLLAKLIILKL